MLVPFLRIIQEYTFNANGCGGAESISGHFDTHSLVDWLKNLIFVGGNAKETKNFLF